MSNDEIDWKQLAIDRAYSRFWAAAGLGMAWGFIFTSLGWMLFS